MVRVIQSAVHGKCRTLNCGLLANTSRADKAQVLMLHCTQDPAPDCWTSAIKEAATQVPRLMGLPDFVMLHANV